MNLKFQNGDRVRTREGDTGEIFQVLPGADSPDGQTRYIVAMDFGYRAFRPGMDNPALQGTWEGQLLVYLGMYLEPEEYN